MKIGLALIAFTVTVFSGGIVSAQEASIRGRVIDSRSAEPIAKATVSIRDRKVETQTSSDGKFEVSGVAPGEIELYITTVGYALDRKKIDVPPSGSIEIEIFLGPEVLPRSDEITVKC
jgi:hypothetical protein